ncbi:hypothetical protein BpHYR1_036260 [Brachionus plicatilis]|uniref:Uncharacterized protein n=1 Tax=Brachionus plicatilis TaxID=10195 RepID=A0A3M7RC76_BRAPC|nr:hypothetical protein BpHYR1_036260 [Brachionus plicatilis]
MKKKHKKFRFKQENYLIFCVHIKFAAGLGTQLWEEKSIFHTQQSSVKMRAQANIYTSNSDESDNDTESKIGNDSIMSDYYESDVNPVCAPKTSKKRVAFADSKIYSKFSKRKLESLTSTSDSESDEKSKKSPRIKQNVSNNSFNGDGPHVGRYNIHGAHFGQKVFEGPRKGLFYRHPKSFNKVYVTDRADHCVKFKKWFSEKSNKIHVFGNSNEMILILGSDFISLSCAMTSTSFSFELLKFLDFVAFFRIINHSTIRIHSQEKLNFLMVICAWKARLPDCWWLATHIGDREPDFLIPGEFLKFESVHTKEQIHIPPIFSASSIS